jgi:hypothetical protein
MEGCRDRSCVHDCKVLRERSHQEGAAKPGVKLVHVEAGEITKAANKYIDDHPEIIAFASERYQDCVKRGLLRPPGNRRKPSQ